MTDAEKAEFMELWESIGYGWGQRDIIRLQLEKRFGSLNDYAWRKLSTCSWSELRRIAVDLLTAQSIEELGLVPGPDSEYRSPEWYAEREKYRADSEGYTFLR
jgi:hypothetical protein